MHFIIIITIVFVFFNDAYQELEVSFEGWWLGPFFRIAQTLSFPLLRHEGRQSLTNMDAFVFWHIKKLCVSCPSISQIYIYATTSLRTHLSEHTHKHTAQTHTQHKFDHLCVMPWILVLQPVLGLT